MSADAARPRIAVLISGAFRTLTDYGETIARHVIDANPWARFGIYAHLVRWPYEQGAGPWKSGWLGSACVAAVRLETNAPSLLEYDESCQILRSCRSAAARQRQGPNIVKMFMAVLAATRGPHR